MSERTLGGYRLLSQLAVGGMAEIYTAKHAGPGGWEKLVALKVIHPNYSQDPEFVEMLVDEAKLTVQLTHANIVQTFDLGRVDETYYIAMELIDGVDLYKLLRKAADREIEFPFEAAAFVAQETCAGLEYAHNKRDSKGRPLQIVHRDVSPQNVLVSHEGHVKLVDFGIAKAARRSRQTAAGVIKGKYYYMSPEQAWGDPIDGRSDVFACGILLYEMITGEMLYLEEDVNVLLEKVRKANIAPPSTKRNGVPRELEEIVMRALKKSLSERWSSAGEMGSALHKFVRSSAPDFTRARLASFVKEVLGGETSQVRDALIAVEPTIDLSPDENSLVFRFANFEAPSARQPDEATAPVSLAKLKLRPAAANGFEESDATIVDMNRSADELTVADLSPTLGGRLTADLDGSSSQSQHTVELRKPPAEPRPLSAAEDTGVDTEVRPRRRTISKVPPSSFQDEPTGGPLPPVPTHELKPRAAEPKPQAAAAAQSPWPLFSNEAPATARSDPFAVPPGASATLAIDSGSFWAGRRSRILLFFVGGGVAAMAALGISLWTGAPSRGALEVASLPPGAEVTVDEHRLANATPLTVGGLDPGRKHHVHVSRAGYDSWDTDFQFEGATRQIRLQAVLVPSVGSVEIRSLPPGAEALVNGISRGETPLTVSDLPSGAPVQIELRLRGYRAAERQLAWQGQSTLSIQIPLEKAH